MRGMDEPEEIATPAYDPIQDMRLRLSVLEAKAARLEREVENLAYMVLGVGLMLFVVFRLLNSRTDIPDLEK
jgi:hypothetical protein